MSRRTHSMTDGHSLFHPPHEQILDSTRTSSLSLLQSGRVWVQLNIPFSIPGQSIMTFNMALAHSSMNFHQIFATKNKYVSKPCIRQFHHLLTFLKLRKQTKTDITML